MSCPQKKVWNEDLIMALRAREEQARQQGKQRQHLFRAGAATIESVREDIYMFSTGRIVNLPTKQLTKTIDDLCRKIIAGTEPVFPAGYVAGTVAANGTTERNPYLDDPYMKRIKTGGGACSILMAFHVCQKSVMTKAELIQVAQPFCDEAMEGNYMQGRTYGAWKGIVTLSKHGLILTSKARVAYDQSAGGMRALGVSSYTITREGEKFIQALLETRPALREMVEKTRGGSRSYAPLDAQNNMDVSGHFGGHIGGSGYATSGPTDSSFVLQHDFPAASPLNAKLVLKAKPVLKPKLVKSVSDEAELRKWVERASGIYT
jgi:hypothetical protein